MHSSGTAMQVIEVTIRPATASRAPVLRRTTTRLPHRAGVIISLLPSSVAVPATSVQLQRRHAAALQSAVPVVQAVAALLTAARAVQVAAALLTVARAAHQEAVPADQ